MGCSFPQGHEQSHQADLKACHLVAQDLHMLWTSEMAVVIGLLRMQGLGIAPQLN